MAIHRPKLRLFLVALTIALATISAVGWRDFSARRAWVGMRPALPAPSGDAAPGLDARLSSCARRLENWPPDQAAWVEFTRLCHANGQADAAMAGYRALATLEPDEPRWPYLLGSLLASQGRTEEARPLYQRATALAPDSALTWLRLGDASLKSNALAEAENAYREAHRRSPGDPYPLLGLARCDLQAQRLTAARLHLQEAVTARPDLAEALSLLASVFERLGNPESAAAARARMPREAAHRDPPDPWLGELLPYSHDPYLLLVSASAAELNGAPRDALPMLARALQLAPDDARVHRELGNVHLALGDLNEARMHFERAAALAPTSDAIWMDLVSALRRMHDEAGVSRTIAAAIAACPASAGLQFEAGLLAASETRWDDAARHFEAAWRLQPDETAAAIELAGVYFQTDRFESGVNTLEILLARQPDNRAALGLLVRHGIDRSDARTSGWLQRAIAAGGPAEALAQLRDDYRRRFGENLP